MLLNAHNSSRGFSRLLGAGVALSLVVGLSGCEQTKDKLRRNSFYHEGVIFKTKTEKNKEDRQAFRVIVRNGSRGLTGAKEAGRLAAHRYCIENYGSTDITYAGNHPEKENSDLVLSGEQLIFSGRCKGW